MLCTGTFNSWANPCTRAYFESLPPFILILVVLCIYIPLPKTLSGVIRSAFTPFLSLEEAQALLDDDSPPQEGEPSVHSVSKPKPPLWRTICLSSLALVETVGWLILACYHRVILLTENVDYRAISPFISFLSWLPAVVIPIFRPTLTPPYDLFSFYVFQLVTGIFRFGAIWYDRDTLGIPVNTWDVVGAAANLVVILSLLVIVLRMPLNLPSTKAVEEKIVSLSLSL